VLHQLVVIAVEQPGLLELILVEEMPLQRPI
jgi:hypothetical protein